jgi:hypothetical protein
MMLAVEPTGVAEGVGVAVSVGVGVGVAVSVGVGVGVAVSVGVGVGVAVSVGVGVGVGVAVSAIATCAPKNDINWNASMTATRRRNHADVRDPLGEPMTFIPLRRM